VVIIVPITKFTPRKKVYPSHHFVKATGDNGLNIDSIVKCEQIRVIAKSRLLHKWGKLSAGDLAQIDIALKIVLSLK
jgi:mRNA interferase MazF